MRGELWRFSRRELANVLSFSENEEFGSTILMLKLFENTLTSGMRDLAVLIENTRHDLDTEGGKKARAGSESSRTEVRREGGGGTPALQGADRALHEMMGKVVDRLDRQQGALDQHTRLLQRSFALLEKQQSDIAAVTCALDLRKNGDQASAPLPPRTASGSRFVARLETPQGSPTNLKTGSSRSMARGSSFKADPWPTQYGAPDYASQLVFVDQQLWNDSSIAPYTSPRRTEPGRRSPASSADYEQSPRIVTSPRDRVSGALERGLQRTLHYHRKHLQSAQRSGDIQDEAKARRNVEKYEKLLEARTVEQAAEVGVIRLQRNVEISVPPQAPEPE